MVSWYAPRFMARGGFRRPPVVVQDVQKGASDRDQSRRVKDTTGQKARGLTAEEPVWPGDAIIQVEVPRHRGKSADSRIDNVYRDLHFRVFAL
jgi:hypothetical protein